ncbi:MAG: type II toxin-antitoxin system prevent-host-death family antitoxin [Longimicrobiaceae bacterium]
MEKRTGVQADRTEARFFDSDQELIPVGATTARKEFGRIFAMLEQGHRILITRRGVPAAVMMPADALGALTAEDSAADAAMLDALTAEFDALLDRMQTPEARAAAHRAFNASPEELGRAAAEAARQQKNR